MREYRMRTIIILLYSFVAAEPSHHAGQIIIRTKKYILFCFELYVT